MMTRRKLEALRNLAERPGTEAEGILAREILARVEAKQPPTDERTFWEILEARAHGEATPEEFAAAMLRQYGTTWTCACGFKVRHGEKCLNLFGTHERIQVEIQTRFKKGDRVFYNCWAYAKNDPAVVVGYVRPKPENGSHPWAWITLKFDKLKSNRQVPIKSSRGWHLSHAPLGDDQARRLSCA